MSRLDRKGGKGVVDFNNPMSSAVSYSEKVKARKDKTLSLKNRSKPLGGAPPIPAGKLDPLVQPVFDEEARQAERAVHEPPQGVGAAYQVNQDLAHGRHKGPVSLGEAHQNQETGLSEETVEGLQRLAETPTEEDTRKPPELEPEAESEESAEAPPFDFSSMIEMRNRLMSDERRKAIEERLAPMDIGDMIVHRELRQEIPIVPDKLHATLRTFSQRENLFCLRYVYDFPGSTAYVEELLNTAKLVCSLYALNGAVLPEHRVNVGQRGEEVDKKLFEEKMFHVASLPIHLVGDLSVQAVWFNDRVNKLFSLDALKNG